MRKVLTPVARELRNDPTEAEKYLWHALRLSGLGVKFRRQGVIGRYIVDFVCYEKRLVIEIDGGQHHENKLDKARDAWLNSQGFQVIRFWNNEVLENLDGVYRKIEEYLNPPTPAPPHKGEGKKEVIEALRRIP